LLNLQHNFGNAKAQIRQKNKAISCQSKREEKHKEKEKKFAEDT
jgi:hypothetical protein